MTSIKDYQDEVDTWIQAHGVRYFNELTNMAMLVEEVGEFSRLVAREYGEQSFKPGKKPDDVKLALADEMSDILFVVTCMANQMDIDLTSALERNLFKKTSRDKDRHKDNEKLY